MFHADIFLLINLRAQFAIVARIVNNFEVVVQFFVLVGVIIRENTFNDDCFVLHFILHFIAWFNVQLLFDVKFLNCFKFRCLDFHLQQLLPLLLLLNIFYFYPDIVKHVHFFPCVIFKLSVLWALNALERDVLMIHHVILKCFRDLRVANNFFIVIIIILDWLCFKQNCFLSIDDNFGRRSTALNASTFANLLVRVNRKATWVRPNFPMLD